MPVSIRCSESCGHSTLPARFFHFAASRDCNYRVFMTAFTPGWFVASRIHKVSSAYMSSFPLCFSTCMGLTSVKQSKTKSKEIKFCRIGPARWKAPFVGCSELTVNLAPDVSSGYSGIEKSMNRPARIPYGSFKHQSVLPLPLPAQM